MVAIVTNSGLAEITEALHNYTNRPKYLQWGVGSGQTVTSTTVADTTGTTEARTDGTSSQQTTTATNDTYQVTGTITALAALAITEVGVFDAAGSGSPPTGGNMAFYGDFSAINVASSDTITFTVQVVFSDV